MALRANTYLSATHFSDYYRHGVTLKRRTLKRLIKKRHLTQRRVAEQLGMSKKTFTRKLYKQRRFNQSEITALIHLFGVRAAFKFIWFPTLQEKRRIEKYVWEEQMSNYYNPNFPHHFETPAEKKKRAIARQSDEYGENWEQSEDFEDLIFDSDELPSRRFMRRRND